MNPIESISSVFRNYVNFSGRAQRSEFWWFTLFSILSQAAVNLIPYVGFIYTLALLLPSLAVTARRLHDTNRSAWWLILYAVAALSWIAGIISLFVALFGAFAYSFSPQLDSESGFVFVGTAFIITLVLFLVGLAATVLLLVLCALPGTAGTNRYGPDPLRPRGAAPGFEPGFAAAGHPYEPSPPAAGLGNFGPDGEPAPHPDLPQAGLSQPASESQRRYCTQCGTQLQSDARFCTFCGTAT